MAASNIISQTEALKCLEQDSASFVDGSWYLPAQNRNGREEYNSMRIPGAVYFDIDAIADPSSDLPHMLPNPQEFAQAVSVMGLEQTKPIIVYDGPGLFSAPRVWWTFKTMGASDVRILEGGFDAWKANTLPVETGNPNPAQPHIFTPGFNASAVASKQSVEDNVPSQEAVVIDARPVARFEGREAEPRPGLRSGHIPGAKALPFSMLIADGKLKPVDELDKIFTDLGIGKNTPVITSCGSGVTAAILTLALEETGRTKHKLYDGSWAEWGLPGGPEISSNG